MPFVDTPRGRFHFETLGDEGPVVYLLHGVTAKLQDWEGVPRGLAEAGFRVFAFDLRGHGLSFWPSEGFTPQDFSEDIEVCAQALGHCTVHLVGHSASGRHALVEAVTHPERVLSLTILDQALGPNPTRWEKYKAIYAGYPTPYADEAALDADLHRRFPEEPRFSWYKGLFKILPDGKWDWNFSTRSVWETQRLGRDRSYLDWIPKVKCPLLFVRGAQAATFPLKRRQRSDPSCHWIDIRYWRARDTRCGKTGKRPFFTRLFRFCDRPPHSDSHA